MRPLVLARAPRSAAPPPPRAPPSRRPAMAMKPAKSSPAQKARPAPESTTARTDGSAASAAPASTSATNISESRALSLSGRLSRTSATPPSMSMVTRSEGTGVASQVMTDVRTLSVTPELLGYAVEHGTWTHDDVLDDLQAETRALGSPAAMQIGPDEGQLLTFLGRLVGARRAVEVGTFTGYSGLCIARGLAPDGKLTCCDVNEEWTAIARRYWERAGEADRIELRLAPPIEHPPPTPPRR